MSCKEYIECYEKMTDRQKDTMYDLYMSGVNYDGHVWVTYGEVERAVAKLLTTPNDGSTSVNLPDLYLCDPDKNTECKKTWCYRNGGECIHTVHKEYRRVD